MIPVLTDDPRYAAAVAALPSRAHAAPDAEGAVVVVSPRAGWSRRVEAAVHAGAVGVVVAGAGAGALDPAELAGALAAVAARADDDLAVPLVIERPRLRADLVAAARSALAPLPSGAPVSARVRTAEVFAPPADLAGVVRDAVGWLRGLSGGDVAPGPSERTRSGLLARVQTTADGLAGLITATGSDSAVGARLRILVSGESRLEITLDEAAALRQVTAWTGDGERRMPRLHESSERVALRRVLDAVGDGIRPADLDDLAHDDAVARALLGG